MRNSNLLLFSVLLMCCVSISRAQTASKELAPGYYVVVGAYAPSREENAKHFVDLLSKRGEDAKYGFNQSRNLYFVYISYFTSLNTSLRSMQAVRKTKKFVDAWVRVVPGVIEMNKPVAVEKPEVSQQQAQDKTKVLSNEVEKDSVTAPDSMGDVVENEEIKQYPVITLGNTEVFLSLYNARNNRIVDGDVQVVDTERSRAIMKVKGNEYLLLPDPKSKSGQLTLICDAFGYRKIQYELNYPFPLADTVKPYIDLIGTTIVMNFDLVRYHKGDIVALYNVYFYNDAAIMTPESKFELNELLVLMRENNKYKIRLHGHTNGNYHGKIITMGESKDFFSLAGTKESIGSANDLSLQRAEVIKAFLVSNGIDQGRVEVKAWGGKRPLYDKKSVNAKQNVRVEVEMLEE